MNTQIQLQRNNLDGYDDKAKLNIEKIKLPKETKADGKSAIEQRKEKTMKLRTTSSIIVVNWSLNNTTTHKDLIVQVPIKL